MLDLSMPVRNPPKLECKLDGGYLVGVDQFG